MRAYSFKPGDLVFHKRFGLGIVIDEWGAIPLLDEAGNPTFKRQKRIRADGTIENERYELTIDCRGIYDVRFGNEAKCRSVHRCGLAVAISQPV